MCSKQIHIQKQILSLFFLKKGDFYFYVVRYEACGQRMAAFIIEFLLLTQFIYF